MLSCIWTTSNKSERLMHLVGWFIWVYDRSVYESRFFSKSFTAPYAVSLLLNWAAWMLCYTVKFREPRCRHAVCHHSVSPPVSPPVAYTVPAEVVICLLLLTWNDLRLDTGYWRVIEFACCSSRSISRVTLGTRFMGLRSLLYIVSVTASD